MFYRFFYFFKNRIFKYSTKNKRPGNFNQIFFNDGVFNNHIFEYEDLTEEEKLVANGIHSWKQAMLENNYFQYRAGLFEEEYWEQTKSRIQSWYDVCDLRPPGQAVASFQEYLNSLPDNCAE